MVQVVTLQSVTDLDANSAICTITNLSSTSGPQPAAFEGIVNLAEITDMVRALVKISILCGIMSWNCRAQDTKSGPEFEVASVKPAAPRPPFAAASGLVRFRSDAGHFEASSETLQALISFAYGTKPGRISGPGWISEEYFAILAKPPAGSTKEEVPAMVQKLLTERFQLTLHRDQKVESVYELVIDKKGAKCKPSNTDASERECMFRPGECFCRASTLRQLADYLSGLMNVGARMAARAQPGEMMERTIDRPVVDATGLTGVYDIDLQWVPPAGLGPVNPVASAGYPPRDASVRADSIFGALEAAGLKLQASKHAFEILVIDHVQRVPSKN